MNLLGMRAKDWRVMLDYNSGDVDKYNIIRNFNDSFHVELNNPLTNWWIDQVGIQPVVQPIQKYISHTSCEMATEVSFRKVS